MNCTQGICLISAEDKSLHSICGIHILIYSEHYRNCLKGFKDISYTLYSESDYNPLTPVKIMELFSV